MLVNTLHILEHLLGKNKGFGLPQAETCRFQPAPDFLPFGKEERNYIHNGPKIINIC